MLTYDAAINVNFLGENMGCKISETLTLSDDKIKELNKCFATSAFNAANGSRYIA